MFPGMPPLPPGHPANRGFPGQVPGRPGPHGGPPLPLPHPNPPFPGQRLLPPLKPPVEEKNYRQEEKKILDSILDQRIYDSRMRPRGVNSTGKVQLGTRQRDSDMVCANVGITGFIFLLSSLALGPAGLGFIP